MSDLKGKLIKTLEEGIEALVVERSKALVAKMTSAFADVMDGVTDVAKRPKPVHPPRGPGKGLRRQYSAQERARIIKTVSKLPPGMKAKWLAREGVIKSTYFNWIGSGKQATKATTKLAKRRKAYPLEYRQRVVAVAKIDGASKTARAEGINLKTLEHWIRTDREKAAA